LVKVGDGHIQAPRGELRWSEDLGIERRLKLEESW
jgi:hypothetical protein